ncbi:MAG: plasmid mobilization protein [Flavobacterium sp.]
MLEVKKERKKGGRPKVNREKLEMILQCRMTRTEYEKVLSDAQKVNLKPSELGRQYITKGFVTNLFSEEEQQEKKQLIGIRNNLNQLVKLAHSMGFRSQVLAIDKMLNEIDSILERYKYVSKSKRNR